jgi:hypothetical protein
VNFCFDVIGVLAMDPQSNPKLWTVSCKALLNSGLPVSCLQRECQRPAPSICWTCDILNLLCWGGDAKTRFAPRLDCFNPTDSTPEVWDLTPCGCKRVHWRSLNEPTKSSAEFTVPVRVTKISARHDTLLTTIDLFVLLLILFHSAADFLVRKQKVSFSR